MPIPGAPPPANPVPATPLPGAPPTDPLAGLHDWHLPDPVSWWPPAPGWWLLAALVLVVLAVAARSWQARRRRDAALHAARAELRALRARLGGTSGDGLTPAAFAAAVSILLRRLALTRFQRARVAGLCGRAWLSFLDDTGGAGAFVTGPGRLLTDLPYRAPGTVTAAEARALADLTERWITTHRSTPRISVVPHAFAPAGSPVTAP